jgi:hypothetical protein
MTKWNVTIGEQTEAYSADLLKMLGFDGPYKNDETNMARDEDGRGYEGNVGRTRLAEAIACGTRGDRAALLAIRMMRERSASQSLETARQKVAELEAEAAADNRAAAGMSLALERERNAR